MITRNFFDTTSHGEKVTRYTLENSHGMRADFLDYGAICMSLYLPDGKGNERDVVLGYDKMSAYEQNGSCFGSFVGRYVNRIGNARFELDGKTYELEKNENCNCIHAGKPGFNHVMYDVKTSSDSKGESITFSRVSPDGEQGFPGNLTYQVTYTITEENEWVIEYQATTDQDTVINFTNHSYFNLSGQGSSDVKDYVVWMNANEITDTDKYMVPNGEFLNIVGTAMDFNEPKKFAKELHSDFSAIVCGGGFNHNYVVNKKSDGVELVAWTYDENAHCKMEVYTDRPGIQFYPGTYIGEDTGKDGVAYHNYSGMCFETQAFPDSCNHDNFPTTRVHKGEVFKSITKYKFIQE
jgi:aldose 1-epimerase